MNAVAENWTQLVAQVRGQRGDDLHTLQRSAQIAPQVIDYPAPALARLFGNAGEPLARMLAVDGSEAVQDQFYLMGDVLPRLLTFGDQVTETAPSNALHVINYLGLARCAGLVPVAGTEDLERSWIERLARRPDLLNEYALRTAAIVCSAVDLPNLVPAFDGGGPLVARTDSQSIAGPNVFGFARHLAEVLEGGGPIEAVEPPWWSFLQMFPLTLASDGVSWVDLVWLSAALMVRFEGRPLSEVGHWLPQLVSEL